MELLNALQLCIWCSWCLFQGLVCSNPQLSPKGCIPVPAQSLVLFSCQHDLTLLGRGGNRDSSCFTQGKSPMSFNIRMDGGVCIYAVEGANTTLGMGVESRWQQPADNPCGELVGLERRQLGIVSKIPCVLSCPPFKLCFLWHPVPSRRECWEASSTHTHPWIQSWGTAGKSTVVEDRDPIIGAEGRRQVQKSEAALPRLTTKPDSDLYNLGFKAWVLSATLQLSLFQALVKGKELKDWESCHKREQGVRVTYPVLHWATVEAKDWGSMGRIPWTEESREGSLQPMVHKSKSGSGAPSRRRPRGCRVEMLTAELLFHWVVLLLCCWGAEYEEWSFSV